MSQTIHPSSSPRRLSAPRIEEFPLKKYWNVLERRWFSVGLIASTIFGLTSIVALQQKPDYVATGKMLFRTDRKPELVGLKGDSAQLQALTTKSDPLTTQAEILQSWPIVRATIKAFDLRDSRNRLVDEKDFIKKLKVKPVIGTDILSVSYPSSNPKKSADIVNYMMRAYIQKNIASNKSEAAAARQFIARQLPSMEAAVSKAELRLKRFKEINGVVQLDKESSAAVETVTEVNKQISQARAQMALANAQAGELRSQTGVDAATGLKLNALNEAEGVKKALGDYQQLRSQLGKEQARFKAGHPAVEYLQRQEQGAKAVLQERVQDILGKNLTVDSGKLQIGKTAQDQIASLAKAEVDRMSVGAQMQSLMATRDAVVNRSKTLPALEKAQRELERQLDAAQSTYKTLLTKFQEVQVAENQAVGNAEIVANAEPPTKPDSPKVLLMMLAGGIMGLLFGVAAAFLMDYRDRTIRTLKEATDILDYPLLGVIPKLTQPQSSEEEAFGITRLDNGDFPAQESYQMLNTSLRFIASEQPRSIVVTSAVRGEGKSTVAANLAVAMAQVQKRVLLIDADMRNPCQHHVWNLTNRIGLTNVLVGQTPVRNAIQVVMPNLHILSVGSIPPNPISLLDSHRLEELIEQMTGQYDVVLMDAPALAGTADATILNKATDGSLLVVRPGVISTTSARAAKEFLDQSGQKVLGMVANSCDSSQGADNYFFYSKDGTATEAPTNSVQA